jgi:small subunit ribosomal protein S17
MRDIGLDIEPPLLICEDRKCPFHGTLSVRGQVFLGIVDRANMNKVVVVKRDYSKKVPKYERLERRRSTIHVYSPSCMDVRVGDIVAIGECRPLNKTTSFVVVENKSNVNFINKSSLKMLRTSKAFFVDELEKHILILSDKVNKAKSSPAESKEFLEYLGQLAVCQKNLYYINRNISDLEDSIGNFKKLIFSTNENPSEKLKTLNNMGIALSDLYYETNEMSIINEAIDTFRNALSFADKSSPFFPILLKNLGDTLIARYKRNDLYSDFDEAIVNYNRILTLPNENVLNRLDIVLTLGNTMKDYYDTHKNMQESANSIKYLKCAIDQIKESLKILPEESIDLPILLIDLGNWLREFYKISSNDRSDADKEQLLDDALDAYNKAAKLIPPDSNHLPILLNNIGNALRDMYIHSNDISFLKSAIEKWHESLDLTPKDSFAHMIRLNNLAVGLLDLYKSERNLNDLNKSLAIFKLIREKL